MLLPKLSDERYQFNGTITYGLYKKNLILYILLGFEFIIKEFRESVFKIVPKLLNGDESIGTGFLIKEDNSFFIVTNKHVVQNNSSLIIYDINDNEIDRNIIFEHPEKDIAIIEVTISSKSQTFQINTQFDILDEVITIGYPSVPMTKLAYQLCHKGEINSIVEDYSNNSLIIFSAKTSSGNSGSPVIDSSGRVIGIVTQELFEKSKFYDKGKLPYYAAITANEIMATFNLFKKK